MKHALAPLAVLCLTSLSFAPTSDEITFAVAKGAKLAKQFDMSMSLEKKEVSITIGDRELPKELLDKFEMAFSVSEAVEFEDEYVEVEGTRTHALVRQFQKAKKHSTEHVEMMGADPTDKDEELESPLIGHAVAFTWNAKSDKYERAFQGEKGDEKWLTSLSEDTDLRALLPEGDATVGQTWKLEAKHFAELVMPGGSLSFKDKDDEMDLDFDKNLTGDIEAKYEGTREVEGDKLGIIAVTSKLAIHRDPEAGAKNPKKIDLSFEIEGEVLWDLEHKHLRSYELFGPIELVMSADQEIEAKGQKLEMKMRFKLEGELKANASVGR